MTASTPRPAARLAVSGATAHHRPDGDKRARARQRCDERRYVRSPSRGKAALVGSWRGATPARDGADRPEPPSCHARFDTQIAAYILNAALRTRACPTSPPSVSGWSCTRRRAARREHAAVQALPSRRRTRRSPLTSPAPGAAGHPRRAELPLIPVLAEWRPRVWPSTAARLTREPRVPIEIGRAGRDLAGWATSSAWDHPTARAGHSSTRQPAPRQAHEDRLLDRCQRARGAAPRTPDFPLLLDWRL